MYADGGGLYLQVSGKGAKSWIYRYASLDGRRRDREMGLGPAHTISLSDARGLAADARKQRLAGIDPIDARRTERAERRLESAKGMTFKQAAEAFIAANKSGWSNKKHAAQWQATLSTYVEPVFGELAVGAIDTTLVLKAIEPVWTTKPETASRLRGRIEAVLDWASARGYRKGENPARWRGHLEKILPAKSRVRKPEHHAALPYEEINAFLKALHQQKGVAALALEFAILTAGRTGEVLGARWGEIDLAAKLWTVPAVRMKAKREHRVPLSDRALFVLDRVKIFGGKDFVFVGARPGKPLSNMALLMTLRRMGREDLTAHGFRSTFRDWAAEKTAFQNEVVEMALAHTVADKVEAAYRRGDLFEKRKGLMADWAIFCATEKPQAS
jgi:integrase